jgi:hypothetical protein
MATDANKSIQTTLDVLNYADNVLLSIFRIISAIKDADPSMTIGDFLEQSNMIYAENIKEIEEWRKEHPGL